MASLLETIFWPESSSSEKSCPSQRDPGKMMERLEKSPITKIRRYRLNLWEKNLDFPPTWALSARSWSLQIGTPLPTPPFSPIRTPDGGGGSCSSDCPDPVSWTSLCHFLSLQLVSVLVFMLTVEKPHLLLSSRTPTGNWPPKAFLPVYSPSTKLLLCSQTLCWELTISYTKEKVPVLGGLFVWHTQITFSNQGRVGTSLILWPIMLLWHLHLAHVYPADTVQSGLLPLISWVTLSKLINDSESHFSLHKTRLIIASTYRAILQVKSFKHRLFPRKTSWNHCCYCAILMISF